MHRRTTALLAALGATLALVVTLLVGVPGAAQADPLPGLPGLPGGGSGGSSGASPRPAPRGEVSAPNQVLRGGCNRYRLNYRVEVPGDQWSAEIFVRNPQGRGIHSFALDSNAPGTRKTGQQTYRLCRASTTYGQHRLRMKVTYCPDADCDEPVVDGFVTPGSFRFTRPRRR